MQKCKCKNANAKMQKCKNAFHHASHLSREKKEGSLPFRRGFLQFLGVFIGMGWCIMIVLFTDVISRIATMFC